MSKPSSPSFIPNRPKTLGLSRRLLVLVFGVGILMIGLFFIFLHASAPKTWQASWSHETAPIDQSNAILQMHQVEHRMQAHSRIGLPSSVLSNHQSAETIEKLPELNTTVFREAGAASISVYQRPASLATAVTKKASTRRTQSNYVLSAGTIIPATLVTGIHSALPGTIIAKVRQDVFDTVSGNYLLIPQGATLIGRYDTKIAYGQSRVLIVWSRLIFPNGESLDLHSMPGADLNGMAGLHDQVNNHYLRLFGSAFLFSLFGAAGQLSQAQHNSGQFSTQQILYAAVGQQMSQTAMQFITKNMDIQPTLKIRPGTSFNVLLTRDMVLPHSYHFLS